ncbi:MAG TPA: anthranilate phosphoribosyltransferase [Actinomycetota bacterium]|nr:anthranilate phosphoribosyltransferase [Actinomycetota bacterium]
MSGEAAGAPPFSWPRVLSLLLEGRSLSEQDSAGAMTEIMAGAAAPSQIAGFVVALRAKGETVDELVGLVRTMRAYAHRVPGTGAVLDTCGTGGDRAGTFNVSTAAALVCAGAGVMVAKHGNRAASSRCGSADVLEALDVRIDLPPEGVAACIERAGIGFCFAPLFHPAMRHAAAPRRELGIPTIFNFLGPLTNPAGVTRQALGVSDRRMLDVMVGALGRLGSERVVGFHGHEGLDELATSGPSEVVELRAGRIERWTLDPRSLGLRLAPLSDVAGGTADDNARAITAVLDGAGGPRRDITLLNAAAGLLAAGRAETMQEGLEEAAAAVDSGAARAALEALVHASQAAGSDGSAEPA